MKQRLLLTAFVLLTAVTGRADVKINESTFPDANFRNWVLSQEYGKDALLTDDEIADVHEIDVCQKKIQSLKGIEHFTALTDLECDDNQLTSIDLSKNTALTRLTIYQTRLRAKRWKRS